MRQSFRFFWLVLIQLLVLLPQGGLGASGLGKPDPDEVRFGITFGGISFTGFIVEYRWGNRSLEMNIGTWTFRDLSLSLVGKQYFGPGDFRPFSGIGLWAVIAPTTDPLKRTGIAVMARAPIGVEWNVDADHHLGTHLNLNRALWIQRKDPLDDYPPTDRIIPLPGFFYLWRNR